MSSWVSVEQVKRLFSTATTLGRLRAYSATSLTSTTPAMLMPQEQTKTPMADLLAGDVTLRWIGLLPGQGGPGLHQGPTGLGHGRRRPR